MKDADRGRYVSADGHVTEPPELWAERLDKRFRDRAPRVEHRSDGDWIIIHTLAPNPVGLEGAVMNDKMTGGVADWGGKRLADSRPGSWDPHARLLDQDLDNLRAEVLYPNYSLNVLWVPDPEYQRACFRAYNDWLAEFCAVAPDRLLGAAALPMKGPIEWMIEEAAHAARQGLTSVLIPAEVPERPYHDPAYEPLWTALRDLDLPVALHIGSTTREQSWAEKYRNMLFGSAVIDNKIVGAEHAMAGLIWAAVPQRYPRLRFVIAEGGIGWVACVLRLMDHWWKDHRRWMEPRLDEPPSAYHYRQFWHTFEDDRPGLLTRELLNVDHLMWGSDYPHTEGTFPRSREQIANDFKDIPEVEVRKMVGENAVKLYGLAD